MPRPVILAHARIMMDRLGIAASAVEFAHAWGTEHRQDRGRISRVIDGAAIKSARLEGVDLSEHRGVEVVLGGDGEVVTVYRHRNERPNRRGRY